MNEAGEHHCQRTVSPDTELALILEIIDSSCPICLNSLLTIVTEEEMALAMDSPATPVQSLGVTKLETCGHIFCRKELSAGT